MKLREKRELEDTLRGYYRMEPDVGDAGAPRALVEALAAELARPMRPRAGTLLAGQVRYIGAISWALHVLVVMTVVLLATSGVPVAAAAGAVGASLALASLAGVTRSRSCGMAELEAACAVNTPAIACARAIVLLCADALVLFMFALMSSKSADFWSVCAQACAPYLVAMGAGFLAARRVAAADATIAAVAAATAVCGACIVARALCPAAFAPAAAAAWWLAAIAACTFAAAEARAWLRAAAVAFVDAPVSARLVR